MNDFCIVFDENMNNENNPDKIIINKLNFVVYKQFLDTIFQFHTESEVLDASALIKSKNIDLT